MTKIRSWIEAIRLRTLPLAIASILMGSFLAISSKEYNWTVIILCIITTLFLQILSNLANDYGDGMKGTDNKERLGPKRTIQSGSISPKEMRLGIVVFMVLSFISGIWLIIESLGMNWQLGLLFLFLGVASIGAAIKYTVGNKAYGYSGFGDVFVFLFFGIIAVLGTYFLNTHSLNWENFVYFALNGAATLFVLPLIYIFEKVFRLVSDESLKELSNTNSKLLRALAEKAPGTFQHSLQVANLAEAAANEVNANAMLVRTGALYHDVGKMLNPMFFTENQSTNVNPHNELTPKDSAQIIINHIIKGVELAKKNHLPDRIIDFIRTHHGTSLVYYFYKKEEEIEGGEVDKKYFQYPGPIPFSKETAILMMCDAVEAASKSLKEPSTQLIDDLVEKVVTGQIENGQFMNADVTFKELQTIKKVLKKKLKNIYHLRIEYPE